MNEWYCVISGDRHGPLSKADLLDWARQGRLSLDDLVWRQGMAEWLPGRSVPELAGEANWLASVPPLPMQQAIAPVSGLVPHRGTAVLVLGILGVVFPCTLVMGIIAWVMGSKDLPEMEAGRMDPSGRGITLAGKICGMVGVFLGIATLILQALWMLLFFGMMATVTAARAVD
ncbi:MAG: GYF domain-containing protein [Planctomycetota bacterium]|jgi:hypothetical protein